MGDSAGLPPVETEPVFRSALNGEHPRRLFDHWLERRAGRAMPGPRDIDPVAIGPDPLPHLYILDLEESDRYRFRLAGTLLPTIFGVEVGGRYLDDVLVGTELENALRSYGVIVQTRRAWRSKAVYRRDGEGLITWQRIALPLGEDGRVERILGGLFIETDTDTFEDYGEIYGRGGLDPVEREERLLA